MVNSVVVHPLVLLSVVDHYNRVAKDTKKRVVGVLLGETYKGKVDITNSYAVPFEEDPKSPTIWYLDHLYHEEMFAMFKKVNAREKVIGWYSTGPKIKPADIEINEVFRRYTSEPVLCIIDVNPKDDLEIPTEAYISVENVPKEKSKAQRTFVHIPSEIGATEPEEVGVEHLLRNIRDRSVGTLSDKVQAKLSSLQGLKKRLEEMQAYLSKVVDGELPVNHQILYNIQDILSLLPDLSDGDVVKAFAVKSNDAMLVLYLSSMIRSILALHNLITNKLTNRALEQEVEEQKENAGEKKEGVVGKDGSADGSAGEGKDKDKEGDKKGDQGKASDDKDKAKGAAAGAGGAAKDDDKAKGAKDDKDAKDKDKDSDRRLSPAKKPSRKGASKKR